MSYSSVEKVIQATGVRAKDFGCEDHELHTILQDWLDEATDLINLDRKRDYEAEAAAEGGNPVPAGIHSIARRIVGNMVSIAMLRRETPVIKVGEWSLNLVNDDVFTAAIRRDLKRYPKKARIGFAVVGEYDEE